MPPARHRRLRREESQAQTRQALLDAGARLFDERGFLATSISDIADEAGYTTGALYSNFASKEDLFLAICEGDFEAVIGELRDLLAAAPTAAERLEVMRAWHLGFVDKRRERTRAMAEFSILVHRNEASRARLRVLAVRVHRAVTSLFEQQQDELGIRFRLPPPVLATAVLAMIQGFTVQAAFDSGAGAEALPVALELLLDHEGAAAATAAPG